MENGDDTRLRFRQQPSGSAGNDFIRVRPPVARPQAAPMPQLQPTLHVRPPAVTQTTTTPQPTQAKRTKYVFKRKWFWATAVIIVILPVAYLFANHSHSKQTTPSVKGVQTINNPADKPTFSIYYPSPTPSELNLVADSVVYAKDTLSFILGQNNQKTLFVNEQPIDASFSFDSYKNKLTSPKSYQSTVGTGVFGGLDKGTVTAIKTDKNTLITVNCVGSNCSTITKQLLDDMQIITDPTTIN